MTCHFHEMMWQNTIECMYKITLHRSPDDNAQQLNTYI
jgi:hypothetical protein